MGATTWTTIKVGRTGHVPVFVLNERGVQVRRVISEDTERALEILSHSVDYLTEDSIYEGEQFRLADPRVQAALLLMQKSQEIYLACPEARSLGQRLKAWLHEWAA